MKIVGLTGGIGSGKTTVAKLFNKLGVPIYIADVEAKALMHRSKVIKRKLIALFGDNAYTEKNTLNKPFIADAIFNDKKMLAQMNAIIHPRVARHFEKWVAKQKGTYVIKEVAILFENGGHKHCDAIITVVAPKDDRILRVIQRDSSSKERVEAIIKNQWTDAEKIALSDVVINNTNLENTKKLVEQTHLDFLKTFHNL